LLSLCSKESKLILWRLGGLGCSCPDIPASNSPSLEFSESSRDRIRLFALSDSRYRLSMSHVVPSESDSDDSWRWRLFPVPIRPFVTSTGCRNPDVSSASQPSKKSSACSSLIRFKLCDCRTRIWCRCRWLVDWSFTVSLPLDVVDCSLFVPGSDIFSVVVESVAVPPVPASPGSWLSLESSFCRSLPSRIALGGGDGVWLEISCSRFRRDSESSSLASELEHDAVRALSNRKRRRCSSRLMTTAPAGVLGNWSNGSTDESLADIDEAGEGPSSASSWIWLRTGAEGTSWGELRVVASFRFGIVILKRAGDPWVLEVALDPVGVVGDPGTDFRSDVGDDPLGVSPPDFRRDPCLLNPPVPICDVRGNGAGVSTFSPDDKPVSPDTAPLSLRSRLMAASANAAADFSAREDVEEWREDLY